MAKQIRQPRHCQMHRIFEMSLRTHKCFLSAVVLIAAALTVVAHALNAPSVFERRTELDGQGCSAIQWTVDHENRKLLLKWRSTPGAQWTAFALTEFGSMKGADMAVVKSSKAGNGPFRVEDRYARNASLPELDVLQNIELLSARYDEQERMEVVIRRDVDTCDSQDIIVASHKQYVICASGSLDDNGEMSYHGPTRSSGLLNFMVDEDLLFERKFQNLEESTNVSKLSDGVVARGNAETATSPFPVDIQMKNITLDSQIVTHYVCAVFEIPLDLRFVSVEDVWGDGVTTSGSVTNAVFHHMHLHYCDDENLIDEQHRDGARWDCFSQMPRCGIKASYAKGTGKNNVPPGLHFDLPKGKYILQVHYENPFGKPIVNDFTGMRLWVQPPALSTGSSSAGLLQIDALHDSISIPADPRQKTVTYQFQISADATRDHVPRGGVLVFAALFHMHRLGSRGRVEVIRDGKRVQTVYQSISYDYDRQVPVWNRWHLMPGDAIVVTCTYKPLVDKDVRGGFRTEDEMCGVHMGTAPEIPNLARCMGAFVKPTEPFLNSYMGPANVNARMLNYSSYKYKPNPVDRAYDTRTGFGDNVCHTMVRSRMQPSFFRFSDAALSASLIIMGAYVFISILSKKRVSQALGIDDPDRRTRRNSIVYIGQTLFSCVALPTAIATLAKTFPDKGFYDAVEPELYTVMRGFVAMQTLLYLVELFYRIQVRISLVLHHLLTAGTMLVIFAFESRIYSDIMYKYGLVLQMLAYTEQPMYTVLLLRNLGYRKKHPRRFKILCRASAFVFLCSRIVIVGLLSALVVQNSDVTATGWRLRNESFADWWNFGDTLVTPTLVNSTMVTLAAGILLANFFALKAMLHMASNPCEALEEAKSRP